MASVHFREQSSLEKGDNPWTDIKETPDQSTAQYAASSISEDEDVKLLARLGYKQELQREFTRWSTVSYAISILGVLGSQPATYGVPITVGGPATAVWAWAIGSIMAYVIATSVSELVSAYPTAGGMYFVTKHVVPKEHVAIWAWVIGWCNFLGQATGVASIAYTIGQMILAGVSMNTGYTEGSYTYRPTAAMTVGVAVATLVIFGAICSLTTKGLHRIVLCFAPINILATLGVCVALLYYTEDKRSLSFVFTDFRDGSGWGNTGFSFLLGFLNVAWVMTDYDGTTHMSEETIDANKRGPEAIRWAVIISGVLGWLLNITFTFCLTETYMDDIVGSPTGLPVAQIFLNAVGKGWGTFMLSLVILVQFFTGASAMLANARMTYAFARDEALPFSGVWSTVNRHTGTPVNAVWLVVGFCACLNLIGIGSTQTITAIFNLCAPCLDLSYIAVLVARLWYADYQKRVTIVQGPYKPWFRVTRNVVAISWVAFISVVLFCPTSNPVTATNMNYAVVVAAAVALFALSWWWLGAKDTYTGPRTQELIIEVVRDDPEAARPGTKSGSGPSESSFSTDGVVQSPPGYNTMSR